MRQSVTASANRTRRMGGAGGRLHRAMAGLLATVLVTGLFGGVLGGVLATEASAATKSVSLNMTSGAFAPQGNPPKTLPPLATPAFTATETPRTGSFKAGILTIPVQHENNTGTKETVKIYESDPGHATGTINTKGNVTIVDTILFEVDITSPLTEQCVTKNPTHLLLQSATPYNSTTHEVTVSDTSFTISDFGTLTAASCTLAATAPGGINQRFSGNVGNVLRLTLQGTLVVPTPGSTTVTTVTASPASPQLAGTTVTLTATLTGTTGSHHAPIKTTPATTAPTGTMSFYSGPTLLAVKQVTGASTAYKTSGLSAGSNTLTAVYSGGNGYAGSTSAGLGYVVTPVPTVTLSLPSTVAAGDATPTPFSLTISNPSTGRAWTNLIAEVALSGIRNLSKSHAVVQYQDASGTWCSLVRYHGTTIVLGFFVGEQSSCTITYPASFTLASNASLTVNFRISYPDSTIATVPFGGTQTVTATLNTGSCGKTTPTTPTAVVCPPVAPLTGTRAPVGSGTFYVTQQAPVASSVLDAATRPASSTVHQTFDVGLRSGVQATTVTETTQTGLPAPSGTVTYTVDGASVYVGAVVLSPINQSYTAIHQFSTATLAPGTYTLVASYSGDRFYAPGSLTETFTVITAPSGTEFHCTLAGLTVATVPAYVTATGTVPSATLATTGSIPATGVTVSIDIDPVRDASEYNDSTQTKATLGFSPTGTNATAGPVTFSGTTGTASAVAASWTGLSTSIPVKAGTAPGTSFAIGARSISFVTGLFGSLGVTCAPVAATAPAPIGTAILAGTTLTASPPSPVVVGTTPVTLTATVFPTPTGSSPASHVTFFDGTTNVGTATVSNTGSAAGTASLTVTPAVGAHVFKATWSGTTTVPANTSNVVSYTVTSVPPPPPPPPSPPVPPTPPTPPVTTTGGYHLVAANGSVYSYGNAAFYGSMGGQTLNKPIVGMANTPGDGGYWLVASDGGIFAFGNAQFYGSMGGKPLNQPIVGIASTPDGKGYWEVASDGGIFAFGDAAFYGSMGGKPLNKPIVGIASTPTGQGYWEVASDGGIFAFGNAAFNGSTGSLTLNKPIVGMAATSNGQGYWLVAQDGGVFAFGNAGFHGTVAGTTSAQIVSLVPTGDNGGYWETASSGQVFQFGDAALAGTALAQTATIVAMSD
jgi:hypothetical protein